jgi:alpha-1,6-mannosyltransferase
LALGSFVLALGLPKQHSKLLYSRSLFLITFAGVIFRSELAVLVFTFSAFIFGIHGPESILSVIIPPGISGLILGLLTTVSVDSYFWQEFPIWPEWSSFYFNTVLGQSSNWGVSPWYFYFTNALPRLLLNPLSYTLLIPLAALQPANKGRSLAILIPSLGFVALYSLLPHKEWRFIIYIVPALTAVAAIGATWIWQRRSKSLLYRLLNLVLISSIIASFAASTGLLVISSLNYPGGEAIVRLRDITMADQGSLHVYTDNLACQTGVTRFLEARDQNSTAGRQKWIFDKTEEPEKLLDPLFWDQLDYAIVESVERSIGRWEVIDVVYGFGGIDIVKPGQEFGLGKEQSSIWTYWNEFGNAMREKITKGWWATLRMEPKLRILKRQRSAPEIDVEVEAKITQEIVR